MRLAPAKRGIRNVVERCFSRFRHWLDLGSRYAKRAAIYQAGLQLIAALTRLP